MVIIQLKLFNLNEILTIAPALFCMRMHTRHAHALNLGHVRHAFGDLYVQQLAVRLVYLISTSSDPRLRSSLSLK